jgi:hypothetical protein
VVDGILTYENPQDLMSQIPLAKFDMEGMAIEGLSADYKARLAEH